MKKKYEIVKLGSVKKSDGTVRRLYSGVYSAAICMKVCPQTIYDYLNGRTSALGKDKRDQIVVVDYSN